MVTVSPLTVTATVPGRHVLEVRGFSGLRRHHCGVDGFLYSPSFTVGGLDWAVRYYPDGDAIPETGSEQYVSAFVELLTEGATAWARVGLGLIDQITGDTVPVLRAKDPVLFDAGCEDSCNWGTGELSRRLDLYDGSRFVLHDRLRIQITIHRCHDRLTFDDRPSDAWRGGNTDPDMILDVAGESFPAHAAVLHARAPGLMNSHCLMPRSELERKTRVYVNGDDMPAPTFRALLSFVYTDTLPVVAGLDGPGNKKMIRQLLVAAKRYGMERLRAICERVMCKSLDVETVVETLAMADRHGFEKLSEACVRFIESPGIRVLLSEYKQ